MSDAASALPFDLDEREPEPRRRRRLWPWLVTLGIVAVLVVGAAVGAEALARGIVTGGVRTLLVSQLDVPADTEIEVEVPGLVLPQLVSGSLDEISVSTPHLEYGPLAGALEVTIADVPLRVDAAAGPGTATVRLDEAQVRALLATIDGFPAEAVGLAAPDVTASTELSAFGVTVPVGIALLPGAADGALTLTPDSFTIADAELGADALRERLGTIADAVLRTWSLCIAGELPAALTLSAVAVDGDELVAEFAIDGRVLADPALRQPGSCA